MTAKGTQVVNCCRILVLGGYGHFGTRIARTLARDDGIVLLIAGRNAAKAAALARELGPRHEALALDHGAPDLAARIAAAGAQLLVHAGGPFQGQDYHVAEACMAADAHYVDLADGRGFVGGIAALDVRARERDLLLVSGASTLPALSSAVIDAHSGQFDRIDTIDISIAPGQRAPRGLATLESVLSYCGKPFEAWDDGKWRTVHGWQDMHRFHYPDLGRRWLARCDVPDLALLPQRYGVTRRVRFDAGLEVALAMWGLWLLAWLVRFGVVGDATRHAQRLQRCGDGFDRLGSDVGGMHVRIAGAAADGVPAGLDWYLTARSGHGPEIPCVAAIVVARELAAGRLAARGAMPCMGLMTLAQFGEAVAHLDIAWRTVFT